MANLSPSRIEPLSPGDQKTADDAPRSRKNAKPQAALKKSAAPSVEIDTDETDKHQLDERA